jgi:diguanylate cyclase (GGDEF)-like protein
MGVIGSLGRLKKPTTKRDARHLVVLYTVISVVVSAGVTYVFAKAQGWPPGSALIPAVSIPLLVAPWMTWTIASYALQLHDMRLEMERLARIDPLSGALNRRGLAAFGEKAFAECAKGGKFSTIVMDIDRFKSINDSYGHAAGDAVITRIVQILRQLTDSDHCVVGRLGGDELVALLVGHSLEETAMLAERIRATIENMLFIHEERLLRVTTSIGVAAADPADRDAEDVLKRADQSLYAAKSAGRNRVRAAA